MLVEVRALKPGDQIAARDQSIVQVIRCKRLSIVEEGVWEIETTIGNAIAYEDDMVECEDRRPTPSGEGQ